ncbi:hypothetical protein C8D76_102184 [Pasteurella langaaensis DSM 22999]|uniref:Uncharacterized protein n=1 Tax=Alitibacter langaaensis DSM 22999 TaxID=1122935 RepID=A0A2U0TD57_9PAST|nr:hypothetical protein [Pasteurella langaaensis]PVX41487.1 hypothetical protein C8D76_102184 [Pasteurella langaaensis DSM 22999]
MLKKRRMHLKNAHHLKLSRAQRTHRLKLLRRHKNKIAERKSLHFFFLENV